MREHPKRFAVKYKLKTIAIFFLSYIVRQVRVVVKETNTKNTSFQNSDKETALHSASQYGHLGTVRILLEHHADPNIKNCRDETPLDLAALYGR